MKCEDCCHAEMCKWIDELKGRGCDFLSQEPCDDAISREELLKAIDTWDKFGYTETGCFVREPKGDYVPYIHYDDVIKCIKDLPPVTQKSGKWINDECGNVICSECKRFRRDCRFGHTNYCNHCGARMYEPQESEEISERNMKMWEEIFKAERSGK